MLLGEGLAVVALKNHSLEASSTSMAFLTIHLLARKVAALGGVDGRGVDLLAAAACQPPLTCFTPRVCVMAKVTAWPAESWWCAASKMLTKQPARAAEDGAGGVGDRGEEGAGIVVQSVRQGLGLRRVAQGWPKAGKLPLGNAGWGRAAAAGVVVADPAAGGRVAARENGRRRGRTARSCRRGRRLRTCCACPTWRKPARRGIQWTRERGRRSGTPCGAVSSVGADGCRTALLCSQPGRTGDQRMSMTSQNGPTFVRAEIRREVAPARSNALLTVDDLLEQFGQDDEPENPNEVGDDSSSLDEEFDGRRPTKGRATALGTLFNTNRRYIRINQLDLTPPCPPVYGACTPHTHAEPCIWAYICRILMYTCKWQAC